MKFLFIGEFGRKELEYEEYLENSELQQMMNDPDRFIVHLGCTILNYDREYLDEHDEERERVLLMKEQAEENPLMFFLPSGDSAKSFLNDTKSSIKLLLAGNRRGKTATGVVDILLDCFPTSDKWPIFQKHGIKHREYRGTEQEPLKVGFASTDWNMVQRVLWPEIKKWIPKYQLGDYDPRKPNHKDIAWRVNPSIKLTCGTHLYFFCYEQKQGAFEGMALDRFYWDEQGHEAKFDGADERLRTRRGRHVFGLTPHKVDGRPDTGARSWIHKIATGATTKGHTVSTFSIGPDDVPDWVYPESEKKKAYDKWIIAPERDGNVKAIKEGRSRYYGEWHDVGGLVFDEWEDKYHLVDPFKIPDNWTRYRAIDHGITNPTACLWAAVSPDGILYLYREYYKSGLTVSENCRNIVELSGNEIVSAGTQYVGSNLLFERKLEKEVKERYRFTVMDSRSFASNDPLTQVSIGKLYQMCGLRATPASGQPAFESIPIFKEMLRVDLSKHHPHNGIMGCPKVLVFRNLVNWRRERSMYAMQEHKSAIASDNSNAKERPIPKDDHLMDCTLYMANIPPRFVRDRWAFYDGKTKTEEEEEEYDNVRDMVRRKRNRFLNRDKFTGY